MTVTFDSPPTFITSWTQRPVIVKPTATPVVILPIPPVGPFPPSLTSSTLPLSVPRRDWLAARRPSTAPASGKSSYDWGDSSPSPYPFPSPTSSRPSTTSGRCVQGVAATFVPSTPVDPSCPHPARRTNSGGWKQGLGLGRRLLARRPATSSGSAHLLATRKADTNDRRQDAQRAMQDILYADRGKTVAQQEHLEKDTTPWLSKRYEGQRRPATSTGADYRENITLTSSSYLKVPPPITSAFSDSEGVRTETATPAPPISPSPWGKARKYTRGLLSSAGGRGAITDIDREGGAFSTGAKGMGSSVVQGVREVFSAKSIPPNPRPNTSAEHVGLGSRGVSAYSEAAEVEPGRYGPVQGPAYQSSLHSPMIDQSLDGKRAFTAGSKRSFGGHLLPQSIRIRRPATAAGALTSPTESLRTSLSSPLPSSCSPTSPLSNTSRGARSATPGVSRRSRSATCHSRMQDFDSPPFAASTNEVYTTSSRTSSRCQLRPDPGPGEDFWVDDEGQMIFRIVPEHNAKLPLVTATLAPERVMNSCSASPGYPLLPYCGPDPRHLESGEEHLVEVTSPASSSPSHASSRSSRAKVTFGPLRLNKPLPPLSGRRSPKRKATHSCSTAPAAKVQRGYLLERSSWNKTEQDVAGRSPSSRKQVRVIDTEGVTRAQLAQRDLNTVAYTPRSFIPHHQHEAFDTGTTPTTRGDPPIDLPLHRSLTLESLPTSSVPPPVPPKSSQPSPLQIGFSEHHVSEAQGHFLRPILQRAQPTVEPTSRHPTLQRSQSSLDLRTAGHRPHCHIYQATTRARSHSDLRYHTAHQQQLPSPLPILTAQELPSRLGSVRPHTSPSPRSRPLRGSRSLLTFSNQSFSGLSPVLEQVELQDIEKNSTDLQNASQKPPELSDRIAHYLTRREEHRPEPIHLPPRKPIQLASFKGTEGSYSCEITGRQTLPAPIFSTVTYDTPLSEEGAMLRPSYPVSPLPSPSSSGGSHDVDSGSSGLTGFRRPCLNARRVQIESQPGFYRSRPSLEALDRITPDGPLHQLFFGDVEYAQPSMQHCVLQRDALETLATRPTAHPYSGATGYDQECPSGGISPLQRAKNSFSQYQKGDDLPGAKARRVLGLNKNAGWEIGEDATDDDEQEALTADIGERNFFRIGRRPRTSLEEKAQSKSVTRRFANKHGDIVPSRSAYLLADCTSGTESSYSSWSLNSLQRPGSSTSDCSSLSNSVGNNAYAKGVLGLRPSSPNSGVSERAKRAGLYNATSELIAAEDSSADEAKRAVKITPPSMPAFAYRSKPLNKASASSSSLPLPPVTPPSRTPRVTVTFTAPAQSTEWTPSMTGASPQRSLSPLDARDVSLGKGSSSRLDAYLRRLKPGHVSSAAAKRPFLRNHSLPGSALPPDEALSNLPSISSSGTVSVQASASTSPMASVGLRDQMLWERTLENSQKDASWQSMIEHRPRPRPRSPVASAATATTVSSSHPDEEQQSPLLGKGKHANTAAFATGVHRTLLLSTPEWTCSDGLSTDTDTPSTLFNSSPASMLWSPETHGFRNRGFSPLTSPYDSDPEGSDKDEDDIYPNHSLSVFRRVAVGAGTSETPSVRCFSDGDNSPTLGYLDLGPEKDDTSSEDGLEMLDERGGKDCDATRTQATSLEIPGLGSPIVTLPPKVMKLASREADHDCTKLEQARESARSLPLVSAQDTVESPQHSSSSCFSSSGRCSSADQWSKRTSSNSEDPSASEMAHNTATTSPDCCTVLPSPKTPGPEGLERAATLGHCQALDAELDELRTRHLVNECLLQGAKRLSIRTTSTMPASSQSRHLDRGLDWALPMPRWRGECSTDAFPVDIDEADGELSDWERSGEDDVPRSSERHVPIGSDSATSHDIFFHSHDFSAHLPEEGMRSPSGQEGQLEEYTGRRDRRLARRSVFLHPSFSSDEEASEDEGHANDDRKTGVVVILPPSTSSHSSHSFSSSEDHPISMPLSLPAPAPTLPLPPLPVFRRKGQSNLERPKTRHGHADGLECETSRPSTSTTSTMTRTRRDPLSSPCSPQQRRECGLGIIELESDKTTKGTEGEEEVGPLNCQMQGFEFDAPRERQIRARREDGGGKGRDGDRKMRRRGGTDLAPLLLQNKESCSSP